MKPEQHYPDKARAAAYTSKLLEENILGAIRLDTTGNCIYVNDAWTELTGLNALEAAGSGWLSIMAQEDQEKTLCTLKKAYVSFGDTVTLPYRFSHLSEGFRYCRIRGKYMSGNGGHYFIGYIFDMTSDWEAHKELKTNNRKLEKQHSEMNRVIRALIHDLNNPLSGISGLTSILLSRDKCPDDISEVLKLIHESSLYSLGMISDMVNAVLNNHEETLNRQDVDLRMLLTDWIRTMACRAAAKGQQLEMEDKTTTKPVHAFVDPGKVRRVVENLIANAIKFSNAGGRISVGLQQEANVSRISVRDEGIGIPPDMKERVFDMFTEARRPGTDGEQPFGLGLSICKQITEAHGGQIWFEGVPGGKGTVFYVTMVS